MTPCASSDARTERGLRSSCAGGETVNWTQLEGRWQQVKGKFRAQFGKLTDDDMQRLNGGKEQLIGALQARYGYEKDEAERQVQTFMDGLREPARARR